MVVPRVFLLLFRLSKIAPVWFLTGLSVMAPSADAFTTPEPSALYGPAIEFDVYRKGARIGSHSVEFRPEGQVLSVDSRFRLQIDVLFFTAYAFDYRSQAQWRDGELVDLRVTVDDNGDSFSLVAERQGAAMRLTRPDESETVAAPVLPTNHWNAAVLRESRVLNTLTGRINNVEIVAEGEEIVPTERGPVRATRYRYTGDLQNEVWYDATGRWVKMRFLGKDGSVIDYVCRRCQGGPAREAIN